MSWIMQGAIRLVIIPDSFSLPMALSWTAPERLMLLRAAFLTAILARVTPTILGEYTFAFESNSLLVNLLGR